MICFSGMSLTRTSSNFYEAIDNLTENGILVREAGHSARGADLFAPHANLRPLLLDFASALSKATREFEKLLHAALDRIRKETVRRPKSRKAASENAYRRFDNARMRLEAV